MRKEYLLGDPASLVTLVNQAVDSYYWNPRYIYVINKTSNPFFLNFGTKKVPTTVLYTRVVAADDSVKLPVYGIREIGMYLPLTPILTDTSQIVQVIVTDEAT